VKVWSEICRGRRRKGKERKEDKKSRDLDIYFIISFSANIIASYLLSNVVSYDIGLTLTTKYFSNFFRLTGYELE